jgi:tetratricopeptide (TPR) repeat protein
MAEGRNEEAVAALRQALKACAPAGRGWHLATSQLNLGAAELQAGNAARARQLFENALALYQDLGDRHFAARVTAQIGYVSLVLGDADAAVAPVDQAMAQFADLGDGWAIAEGLEAVAAVHAEADPAASVRLAAVAHRLRESIAMRPHPPDALINNRQLELSRGRLSRGEFARAWSEGLGTPVADAISLARARARARPLQI